MCHLKFLYYHDLVPYDTELVWATEQKLVKLQSSKFMIYSRSICGGFGHTTWAYLYAKDEAMDEDHGDK